MAIVQLFPSGSSFAPGVVTAFPADVVPFINSAQETDYEANFTYQSSNLGIGLSSSLLARLHVKGANDSSGEALHIQSSTYDLLKAYNNRTLVFGPGSAATTTSYSFNAIGAGGTDTTLSLQITGGSSDNIFKFYNSTSYTRGGLEITRNGFSHSRYALRIFGVTTEALRITAAGDIAFPTASTYVDTGAYSIHRSNTAGYVGLVINGTDETGGSIIFHRGRSQAGINNSNSSAMVRAYTTYVDTGLAQSGTINVLKIDPTFNLTNAASAPDFIGIDWDPILTSVQLSRNYALLMRSGLSGFGLGATLPTAVVDLASSTTARASLRVQPGTAPTSPNNGDIWTDTTDLFIRLNGTTYTITKT
jgi:hypothetical protein